VDTRVWRERWRRFWHTDNPRVASLRDLAVALTVLGLVLGGLWIYTGQPFPSQPPLVVVESGSMMHGKGSPCLTGATCAPYGAPSFGRVGTIDPGDLVFVKREGSPGGIETAFGSGKRSGYGGHGDVIVYKSVPRDLLIIHRAMLYIEASPDGCRPNDVAEPCTYRVPETCDAETFARFVQPGDSSDWRRYCEGSDEPITLTLQRDGLFLQLNDYPCRQVCEPFHSGFITKGDNNPGQDQPPTHMPGSGAGNTCCPVPLDRIVGKARGEIPWFGLLKLAFAGNPRYRAGDDPTGAAQWKFLAARAPWDEWVAFFFVIGVFVAAPPAFEAVMRRVKKPKA
jgi:signal peptidase I